MQQRRSVRQSRWSTPWPRSTRWTSTPVGLADLTSHKPLRGASGQAMEFAVGEVQDPRHPGRRRPDETVPEGRTRTAPSCVWCLSGDFTSRNVMIDPAAASVKAVLDWGTVHAR